MSKDKAPQATPPAPDQTETTAKLVAHLESLTAEVVAQKKETADLKKSLAELAADTAKPTADLEALAGEVATLKEENASLKKSLAELAAGTATSSDAPVKPTLPKNARFKVDGTTYEILAPVMDIPGIGRRTAEELLLDKAAQKKLVDRKAGVIKEVL